MVLPVLRFNFASPQGDPTTQGALLNAALELAQWTDTRGVVAVSIDEHHVTGHAWSCNPIMIAGMFLARTSRIIASVDCVLGPLWHPLRLAEDIAVVDAMSGGRLHTTIGLGYRAVEYNALGVDFTRRGELMDELLATMLNAWSGRSTLIGDPNARIGAGTRTRSHPPIYVGGGVRATARRAVRFKLPLSLPDHRPDIAAYYTELCQQAGIPKVILMPPAVNRGMIFLHEDPEKAWADLGSYLLWEAVVYGRWSEGQRRSSMHLPGVQTLDQVKQSGRYRFLTPDQLIGEVRESSDYGPIVMHPLVGGMPVEEAWKSVQLLVDTVLPALR